MKAYQVVQHFTGYLSHTVVANTPKEAKEIFLDETLPKGKQLENIAGSRFEWEDIDVYNND